MNDEASDGLNTTTATKTHYESNAATTTHLMQDGMAMCLMHLDEDYRGLQAM